MDINKFKALVHANTYIDSNLLEKGLYGTSKPSLYPIETTMEMLEEQYAQMKIFGFGNVVENLKKCQLIEVSVLPSSSINGSISQAERCDVRECLLNEILEKIIPIHHEEDFYDELDEVAEHYSSNISKLIHELTNMRNDEIKRGLIHKENSK